MKTHFDEWFDLRFPEGTLGPVIIRESFCEVAKEAWFAGRWKFIEEMDDAHGT